MYFLIQILINNSYKKQFKIFNQKMNNKNYIKIYNSYF